MRVTADLIFLHTFALLDGSFTVRRWANASFRTRMIASIITVNMFISLAILGAVLLTGYLPAACTMLLHTLFLVTVLRGVIAEGREKPQMRFFCAINLITWPLLQELIGGISASGGVMMWMFMGPLLAGFVAERKIATRIFWVCLMMLLVAVGLELVRQDHGFSPVLFLLNISGVSMICYLSITVFLDRMNSLRERSREQTQDIQSSIRYAQHIQTAILPSRDSLSAALGEVALFYSPKDIVSGDFYWIAERDGVTIVAVADCTGHGVPGGFMTMLGVNSMNHIILDKGIIDPAMILHYLHWCIREPFDRSDIRITDGMDISICCIDRQRSTLTYSGAMSSLFHMNGHLRTYTSARLSIGDPSSPLTFQNIVIPYGPGDRFYMCSDGFTDQFGGDREKRYGRHRMREFLERIEGYAMAQQQHMVEMEFKTWKGGRDQVDDVLFLGFAVN